MPNTDVRRFTPASVSHLRELWLIKTNRVTGEVTEIPVFMRKGKRLGSFSTEFLIHIQKVGAKLDKDDNYIIPLAEWNLNYPIIYIPDVEFSFPSMANRVGNIFNGADGNKGKTSADNEVEEDVTSINSQEGLLHRLFTEVNSRLDVNMALLEVLVAGYSVNNYEAGDFSLAHGSDTASVRNTKVILKNGSMGAAYAYEDHMKIMMVPEAFSTTQPLNHLMDVFLAPAETIEDYEKHPIVN